MKAAWTDEALGDLARLHEFLAPVNPAAAARVITSLTGAVDRLIERPRIGEQLEQYAPREVRRLLVGRYEMRYELQGQMLYVLRIWHTREQR